MVTSSSNKAFAARLNEALDDKRVPPKGQGRQQAVGRIFGVSQKAARKWLEGEGRPKGERAAEIAVRLGVSYDWLMTGKGNKHPEAIPSGQAVAPWSIGDPVPDYEVELPVLNVEASAGDGLLVDDEHVRNRLRFQREWLRKKGVNVADAALIYATGDSMAPYIQAGDLVLIDTSQRNLVDDEVFVIRNGHGELRIKRLQRLYDGRIRLKSDNPAYAPEDLAPGVEVDIVGRFVWRGG